MEQVKVDFRYCNNKCDVFIFLKSQYSCGMNKKWCIYIYVMLFVVLMIYVFGKLGLVCGDMLV